MKKIALTLITILFATQIFAQNITADTTLANQYYTTANTFLKSYELDSTLLYAEKAQELYVKHLGEKSLKNGNCIYTIGVVYYYASMYDKVVENWLKVLEIQLKILGEKNIYVAKTYNSLGVISVDKFEYDKALKYYMKSLEIKLELFGEKHAAVSMAYNNLGNLFEDKSEYDKALEYHFKSLEISLELFGEKHADVASSYNNIGVIYVAKSEYDKALEFYFKSLEIKLELLGNKNLSVAGCYSNIGNVYIDKSEYDKALEYHFKSLDIKIELRGEKDISVSNSYINIGNIYNSISKYDKGLKYFMKGLEIQLELLGETHIYVASSYNNIGNIFADKTEYNKALEFYFKSLEIKLKLFGKRHIEVTSSYGNIGIVYAKKLEYDKALEYFFNALEIKLELLGEKHTAVANSYSNIGAIYSDKGEPDKALEYYFASLEIRLELFGEKNTAVATSYSNIGAIYSDKFEYDKALEYYFKSFKIRRELLDEKHSDFALTFKNIGAVYIGKLEYDKALVYYQKEVSSCLYNFNDTVNIYSIPEIKDYLGWNYLLQGLESKAKILSDTAKALSGINNNERLNIALKHYQACDTLVSQVRKEISTKSDKLALGEQANEVYKGAINVCLQLFQQTNNKDFLQQAFYFSEKNKSAVLQESIAGAEAMRYAGIPDSLLNLEHNLSIDIASYGNLKNNAKNDSIANVWNNKLFNANRSYDSLMTTFETQYPKYYDLKYNNSTVSVNELQQNLDNNTAMFSYLIGDSTITIFALSNTNYLTKQVQLPSDFDDNIKGLRNFLSYENSKLSRGVQPFAFKKKSLLNVNSLNQIYNTLFPENIFADLQKNTSQKITNLLIIPDGKLASIPFEILNTTAFNSEDSSRINYSEMPFLIKDYSISYSYSASLFYNSLYKEKKQQDSKDWIGFAPVFDDKQINSTNEQTRGIIQSQTDSLQTRSLLADGTYISPLPGTKEEVESIFKLFKKKHKKALIKTYSQANESFIKSDEIQDYRIIHLATHGFVNEENPKLSGILFAQDTSVIDTESFENIAGLITNQNEGVLYQSELYNCKFNADLTVLSACETALGKITKGEGVVGLTQALLYAGSRNLLVSLWQVSDESTKELMIDFYKNLLKSKKQEKYSNHLRKAKLKMIKDEKYAHPYYWSPFILIGE